MTADNFLAFYGHPLGYIWRRRYDRNETLKKEEGSFDKVTKNSVNSAKNYSKLTVYGGKCAFKFRNNRVSLY